MKNFKIGDIVVCVFPEGSDLTKNKSYVVKDDSYLYEEIEYVTLEDNYTTSILEYSQTTFYATRFINNVKARKLKLQKINENK